MNNSENPPNNVIPISRFSSTKETDGYQKETPSPRMVEAPPEMELPDIVLFSLDEVEDILERVAARCIATSAEINTLCREGFYVQMLPPNLHWQPVVRSDGQAGILLTDIEFQYKAEPLDPKRIKTVDLRDEMSQRRSPDFQEPPVS